MVRRGRLWAEFGLQLALLAVAVSLLDVFVFAVANRVGMTDATLGLAEQTAEVLADQVAHTPREDWRELTERYRRAPVASLAVYGPDGVLVAGEDRASASRVQAVFVGRETQAETTADGVQVLAPAGSPGRPVAVVGVEMDTRALAGPAWVVAAIHAVASGALIVGFGWFLLRRTVLIPLDTLREATRRIAGGEFGAQVSEDAPAELAELGQALNSMSTALSDYRRDTADQLARLHAANAELRRTQEALVRSEKLASVGRLAAGLAHELGNPLAAVRGYVELLAGAGLAAGEAEELVARTQVEVERMHALLRNLLDFAREEAPVVAPVDVARLFAEAITTVRHQPDFREVSVTTDVAPGLHLSGDPSQLHQVVVNLLLNAAGARARKITLLGECRDGETVLACRDDGEGMGPERARRIFEPFFTTRPPGSGTGLGLAIVQRIVEQHRGRIEVDSAPGRGTTFWLRWDGSPSPVG